MNTPPTGPLSLAEAQRLILQHVHPTIAELAPLSLAVGRIVSRTIQAPRPVPDFPRAAMDGFAVASRDLTTAKPESPCRLPVNGEIAAGTTDIRRLVRGEARRIMTGGAIPPGADQVVPLERCREEKGSIVIEQTGRPGLHIRARGTDCPRGRAIVTAGRTVCPEHLPLLAEGGVSQLPVFTRPRIGVLCTGSELVDVATIPEHGQIIGGNRFLLDGLIRQSGGVPVDLGLVADRLDLTLATLREQHDTDLQMLVTTGGMGPGKYDLMEQVLTELGARILYRTLRVRPGKATIFALLGTTPLFAMPGPPPAVRTLFNELLRPAIRKAQGLRQPLPRPVRATLTEPIILSRAGYLNLKGGVMACRNGKMVVRPASRTEPVNAVILIPPHRRRLQAGETVATHPTINWGSME
ncbi:MAG: molybdopterin molybdotransferase MoeA [Desulfobulbaceae bacterium]|nr:molybdopterin molybdotransferase MoeA [Desulfobulbaceae bacterium]